MASVVINTNSKENMIRRQIKGFHEEWSFLSNFYLIKIEYEGIEYPSTEHAYQAAKFLDEDRRMKIASMPSPGAAKREGRKPGVREDWEEVKNGIMMDVCILKFAQPKMAKLLLESGDAYLEETNTWNDTYWGVCDGIGRNQLGTTLMFIRDQLLEIYGIKS